MYIDLIIVIVLIIVSFAWYRRFSKTVYCIAVMDIFFRLIHHISENIGIPGFDEWVKSIFPSSIPNLLSYGCFLVLYNSNTFKKEIKD